MEAVVRVLRKEGWGTGFEIVGGGAALRGAAWNGHEAVVSLLLSG